MSKRSPGGVVAAAVVWIIIAGLIAAAYRYLLHPKLKEKLQRETGSSSQYTEEIRMALDSFSGYCVFRSREMQRRLKSQGIKLVLEDDGANYEARIRALRAGEVQLAVFTIDSFLVAGSGLSEFPATIVMVVDETKGADAIVAYRQGVASLGDLNDPAARIVLTPNSPSEFLARVAVAHFNLPRLPDRWWIEADGAGDVYKMFASADPARKRAYVMWEPFVSRAREEPDAVVLLDSSKLKGYIVDVLVAEREFLREHPDRVRAVVEAYLRSAYAVSRGSGMVDLVLEDAATTGTRGIGKEQAKRLADGIQWKNTLENYAHFGIEADGKGSGVPHIEDMILQITEVLVKTGALERDPADGQAHTLFYRTVLDEVKSDGFHPARELDILPGVGPGLEETESIRGENVLQALTDDEWGRLVPVGEMNVPAIAFARGTARLHVASRRSLSELSRRMESFPRFYVVVMGHTRAEGDPDANRALAQARAQAAADFLVEEGFDPNRLNARVGQTSQGGGQAQSVSFLIGQLPY